MSFREQHYLYHAVRLDDYFKEFVLYTLFIR